MRSIVPDGVIMIDTGCGSGHPVIEQMYAPEVVSAVDALKRSRA